MAPCPEGNAWSHRLAQEHLAAGVAGALLPTRLAAYGRPGFPAPHPLQRAGLPVPRPTGRPVVRTFGCNSGQP